MINIDKSLKKMISNNKSFSNTFKNPLLGKSISFSNTFKNISFNNSITPTKNISFSNMFNTNIIKGASIQKQQQWGQMSFGNKTVQRILRVDTDKDRVPNRWDCQPLNRWRQDTKPNRIMKDRINKLPIYSHKGKPKTDYWAYGTESGTVGEYKDISKRGDVIPLSKSPKNVKQQIYKTFKKHPHLMSDLEKSKAGVLVVRNDIPYEHLVKGYNFPHINPETKKLDKTTVVLFNEREKERNPRIADINAETLFHELKHAEQSKDMSYDDYVKQNIVQGKLKYFEQPDEKEAFNYQLEKLGERLSETELKPFKLIHEFKKREYGKYEDKKITIEEFKEHTKSFEEDSLQKQQEWQNMNEVEKDIERITKPDEDEDGIPDEYETTKREQNDRLQIPHWLFNQLNAQQKEQAKDMIFNKGYNAGQVADYFEVDNIYKGRIKRTPIRRTRSQKIWALQELGQRLGRTPISTDIKSNNLSMSTAGAYVEEFGTWNNALMAAGFEPTKLPVHSKILAIRKIEKAGGKIITPEEVHKQHYERPEVKKKIVENYYNPEVIERRRKYEQRPEVKKRKREYYHQNLIDSAKEYEQRPEVIERRRKYEQRPEVIERRRKYKQRLEVKERIKQQKKEYYQRPEVKEKKKEYYQKQKELNKQQESEGATEEKQQEWQNMNEVEKDIERITKPDEDEDGIPDEYDEDEDIREEE